MIPECHVYLHGNYVWYLGCVTRPVDLHTETSHGKAKELTEKSASVIGLLNSPQTCDLRRPRTKVHPQVPQFCTFAFHPARRCSVLLWPGLKFVLREVIRFCCLVLLFFMASGWFVEALERWWYGVSSEGILRSLHGLKRVG